MTADDAKELVEQYEQNELRHGPLFKMRLAWLCGIINEQIKWAARKGETDICVSTFSRRKRKYIRSLADIYTKQGYEVKYSISGLSSISLSWEKDRQNNI